MRLTANPCFVRLTLTQKGFAVEEVIAIGVERAQVREKVATLSSANASLGLTKDGLGLFSNLCDGAT